MEICFILQRLYPGEYFENIQHHYVLLSGYSLFPVHNLSEATSVVANRAAA